MKVPLQPKWLHILFTPYLINASSSSVALMSPGAAARARLPYMSAAPCHSRPSSERHRSYIALIYEHAMSHERFVAGEPNTLQTDACVGLGPIFSVKLTQPNFISGSSLMHKTLKKTSQNNARTQEHEHYTLSHNGT